MPRRTLATAVACLACLLLATAHAIDPLTLEAETDGNRGTTTELFRDKAASGGKCVGLMLQSRDGNSLRFTPVLPRGDYRATVYLQPRHLATTHGLLASIRAGSEGRQIQQGQFDAAGGWEAFSLTFTHPGGPSEISVQAVGSSGYDGMRQATSDEEKAATSSDTITNTLTDIAIDTTVDLGGELGGDLGGLQLEAEKELASVGTGILVLGVDRVLITPVRPTDAVITAFEVDKVHYLPGQTVTASATVLAPAGDYELVATDITELDSRREVWRGPLSVPADERAPVTFTYALPETRGQFGHQLILQLQRGGATLHDADAIFGCTANVYRMGITGNAAGQDKRKLTAEAAEAMMRKNKAAYANYFECFAWAPCDYSELTPDTEIFYSGQTQYPGSITGFKNLLGQAERFGVKGITYGKACAAGIYGVEDWQEWPEYYGQSPWGPSTEAYNTFYLERMLDGAYNLHAPPEEGGWQHWASIWTNMGPGATDHGAEEIIASARMLGWDGVRWDGHFSNQMARFKAKVNAELPTFVHGYNIAFANPGQDVFLPPADLVEDFHECARDHGLMMDESVRDWSHTNFSPATQYPFYRALAREADYIKRIGGLPLYITFDMASPQDTLQCVLVGLAAGQRYTYLTSPAGGFNYGPLPKFLTRYAAYVWDDTARIAAPETVVTVRAPEGPAPQQKPAGPWWQDTVWLRQLPDGRQQVLVNLVNPPNYIRFNDRVQTPPRHVQDLTVGVKVPAGARVTRAFHISPDLAAGHELLTPTTDAGGMTAVTLPRFGLWSIVAFELEGAPSPAFPLTTPVEDAAAILSAQQEAKQKEAAKARANAAIGPGEVPAYRDFENARNIDLERKEKADVPDGLVVRRDGVLDVHHAHGLLAWLNPLESAVAMAGGGRYTVSWVDRVGFRFSGQAENGCLDDFPESWRDLFANDVVVLDNLNRGEIGNKMRVRLERYVADGGGLLVFGGYMNLSMGADRNSIMESLVPVTITAPNNLAISREGLPLHAEPGSILADLDWSQPPVAMQVDLSPPADGAQVLARVGEHPAIVAQSYGKGRVVVVLMNPMGHVPDGVTPYWKWRQYPYVMARLLSYLAPEAHSVVAPPTVVRKLDPKHVMPDHFMLEAFDMDHVQFTKALASACNNIIDTETARQVLTTALEYRDKCADIELLRKVAETAAPYMDASFAPLAEKMTKDTLSYNRAAGYRVLGLTDDREHVPLLIAAMRKETEPFIRRDLLLAIGRLGDPRAVPAVERYLEDAQQGHGRLLALTVLHQMGVADAFARALPAYVEMSEYRLKLKSGRRSLIDTLYGGTSFKLTPEARRKLEGDLIRIKITESNTQDDLMRFRAAIVNLSDTQLEQLADFAATTTDRKVVPLAFQVFAPLPPERFGPLKPVLAEAQLDTVRLLAH